MRLFLEPLIFREAKSTDSRAMGFWTYARTDAILKNAFFKIPFYELNPSKRGRTEHSRLLPCSRGVSSCCVPQSNTNIILENYFTLWRAPLLSTCFATKVEQKSGSFLFFTVAYFSPYPHSNTNFILKNYIKLWGAPLLSTCFATTASRPSLTKNRAPF